MNCKRQAVCRGKALRIIGVRPRLGMGRPQKRWLRDACDGAGVSPHFGLQDFVAMLPQTCSDRRDTHRTLRQYGIRIRRKRRSGMEELARWFVRSFVGCLTTRPSSVASLGNLAFKPSVFKSVAKRSASPSSMTPTSFSCDMDENTISQPFAPCVEHSKRLPYAADWMELKRYAFMEPFLKDHIA